MDEPSTSFLDASFLDISTSASLPDTPQPNIDPLIQRLVDAALHPKKVANLRVECTESISVSTGDVLGTTYALTDGHGSIKLGDDYDVCGAICRLTRLLGAALDEVAKAARDTRIVELYKALIPVPDSQSTRNALWSVMTAQERREADISRDFEETGMTPPLEDGFCGNPPAQLGADEDVVCPNCHGRGMLIIPESAPIPCGHCATTGWVTPV